MKSFEAWTDEIRAMMNPPKPEHVTLKGEDLPHYFATLNITLEEARKLFNEPPETKLLWFGNPSRGSWVHNEFLHGHFDSLVDPMDRAKWRTQFYDYDQYGRIKWHSDAELHKRGLSKFDRRVAKREHEALYPHAAWVTPDVDKQSRLAWRGFDFSNGKDRTAIALRRGNEIHSILLDDDYEAHR